MVIFTPNTVIRSTEINANFADSIDSSKHINPYMFSAYKSANTAVNDGAYSDVVFNTERFDTNNNYDNSTGIYTVPITGYYQFNIKVRISTNNAGSGTKFLWSSEVFLYDIGLAGSFDTSRHYVYDTGRFVLHDNTIVNTSYLTAGKTIKIRATADTNESSQFYIVGGVFTNISGFLVSI
jgi:hypothetical protein